MRGESFLRISFLLPTFHYYQCVTAAVTLNMLYSVSDTGCVRLEGSYSDFLCLGTWVEFEVLIQVATYVIVFVL
jgi:hypothetical protein